MFEANLDDELEVELSREEIRSRSIGDTPLRRIGELVKVSMSLLFTDQPITRTNISKKIKSCTLREVETVYSILTFTKAYIPSKEKYHLFQYQLPFILMANKLLVEIGYGSQTVQFIPIIKPTSLHALLLDTTTLYQVFCSSKASPRMFLRDFQGNLIQEGTVLANKDAVFSSFFRIDTLKKTTASYSLQFMNRIHILPGLKTVRLYGNFQTVSLRKKNTPSTRKQTDRPLSDSDKATLESMYHRRSALQVELTNKVKELDQFLLGHDSVGLLKTRWRDDVDHRDEWYKRVEDTKMKKRTLMTDIANSKQEIQTLRRQIVEFKQSTPSFSSSKESIHFVNNSPCHQKAEMCRFHDDLNLDKAVFCGTDNGVIKTTETSYFEMKRFTFHLELYNRFQVLGKLVAQSFSLCRLN